MGKHKNNYKSKNGRYYVLKGSNAVMIAYNWDQANECFRKYICSPKRQISHCSYLDAQHCLKQSIKNMIYYNVIINC